VVLPQNADLAVLVADGPAVQKQAEFGGKGDGHGDDRGKVEIISIIPPVLGDGPDRLDNDDDGNRDHEEAEEDIASRLDAGFAGGELAGVDALYGATAENQGQIGQRVEERVGHGGEQRQRQRGHGGVQLQRCEDDIGDEASDDGNPVFQVVCALLVLGLAAMVVDGLEQALDVLILRLVELLHLPRRVRFFVQRYGTEAVALPGCVRPYIRKLFLWF
jgi:hypothetical protein